MEKFSPVTLTRLLVFVTLMNTVLFIAAAVLHEAGHALLGIYSGCRDIAVVMFELPSQATYTAMKCPAPLEGPAILLSSFIIILPVSLLFLSLKGFRERYMGMIILGGNLIGALMDAAAFTPSFLVRYAMVLAGVFLVLVGEDMMVKATLQEKTPDISERRAGEVEEGEEGEDEEESGDHGRGEFGGIDEEWKEEKVSKEEVEEVLGQREEGDRETKPS